MTVINTNTASINAQYNLSKVNKEMESAMEALSSGKRINSAADDAAGLSIATRMESQVRGLNQAMRNVGDAISLTGVAEGAMEEVGNILQRMNELAVQASNGAMNPSDRGALQDEMDVLISEVDRIAEQTRFNNINVLDGSFDDEFLVGEKAGETIGVKIGDLRSTAFGIGAYGDNSIEISKMRGNVSGSDAIAQISTVTISDAAAGDQFKIKVDHAEVTYTVTGNEGNVGGIRNALITAINNDAGTKGIVEATQGGAQDELVLTAKQAGDAFNVTTGAFGVGQINGVEATVTTSQQNVTARGAEAQVDEITINGETEAGDTYTLSVNGQSISYEVAAGATTRDDVVAGLIAQAALDGYFSENFTLAKNPPTASGDAVTGLTITANDAGTGFNTSVETSNRTASVTAVQKSVDNANSIAQQGKFQFDFAGTGTVELGDEYVVSIGDQDFSYTAQYQGTPSTLDDIDEVVNQLLTQINAADGNADFGQAGTVTASLMSGSNTKLQIAFANDFSAVVSTTINNTDAAGNDNSVATPTRDHIYAAQTTGVHTLDIPALSSLSAGETLKFTPTINGATVTDMTSYEVTQADIDGGQLAFRETLVNHMNSNGPTGVTFASGGANDEILAIPATGGTSADITDGALTIATAGEHAISSIDIFDTKSVHKVDMSATGLSDGDVVNFTFQIEGADVVSADFTMTAASVASASATLNFFKEQLGADTNVGALADFTIDGDDLVVTAVAAGTDSDIESLIIGDGAAGTEDAYSDTAGAGTMGVTEVAAAVDGALLEATDTLTIVGTLDDGTTDTQTLTLDATAVASNDNLASFIARELNAANTAGELGALATFTAVGDSVEILMKDGGTAKDFSTFTIAAADSASNAISLEGANLEFSTTTAAVNSSDVAGAFAVGTPSQDQVLQQDTITISGATEEGDVFTLTVDGSDYEYVVSGSEGSQLAQLRNAIVADFGTNGLAGTTLSAGTAAGEIVIEQTAAGSHSVSATFVDRGTTQNTNATVILDQAYSEAEKQKDFFQLAGNLEVDDKFRIAVDGQTLEVEVTTDMVSGGLAAAAEAIVAKVNNETGTPWTGLVASTTDVAGQIQFEAAAAGSGFEAQITTLNRDTLDQSMRVETTTDNVTSRDAVKQTDVVTISDTQSGTFTAGQTFNLETLVDTDNDGTTDTTISASYTTTVGGADTLDDVLQGLVDDFNSEAPGNSVIASVSSFLDGTISLQAEVAGHGLSSQLDDGTNSTGAVSSTVEITRENGGAAQDVAQQELVMLNGTLEAQDTYTLSIDDTEVSYTTTGNENDLFDVAVKLADLVNGNGNLNQLVKAEAQENGGLLLTAVTAGEGFTVGGGAENGIGGSIATLSVLDQDRAQSALDVIAAAMERVNNERSSLGAIDNRLNHTLSNLGNIVVNTEAAQSRVEDADFAKVTAELTKAQIMSQAATAMLAQANASKQGVLSLLQG